MKCSICGKMINGPGNNPAPLKRKNCCDDCNRQIVIPLRIYLSGGDKTHVLLIEPNFIMSYLEVKAAKIPLKTLQEMVDGYIQIYPKVDDDFLYIVDEEGIIKGKQLNLLASELFGIKIVGNLVILPKHLFE